MADSTERLLFEIFAKDVNAERTFDKVGRGAKRIGEDIDDLGGSAGVAAGEFDDLAESVDKAGKKVKSAAADVKQIDKQIAETKARLQELIAEFNKTGDVELFKKIRKDRSTLAFLESIKKHLPKPQDFFSDFISSGAAKLPAVAIGVEVAAALAAPIGAAIAGAVVGAVGLGGVIGGVAAAAQDERVKSEAAKVGREFMANLKGSAAPFIGPLLAEFGELGEIGASFTADLHAGFTKLAPLVKPLVEGLRGFTKNLNIGEMFEAAQPAIRALAHELPEIGAALNDMFMTLTEDDRATEGLIGLLHVTEDLIRVTGWFIGYLEFLYDDLVKVGTELDKFKENTGQLTTNFGFVFGYLTDEATKVTDATNKAGDATGDFNTTVVGLKGSMYDVANATDDARDAMVDFAKAEQDQFDPMANLIHRLDDVKKAHKDYSDAIAEHGRKSPEAREANLLLAEAILSANSAAAKAQDTFGGKLPLALRETLKAGHMTEDQIRDVEKAFAAAKKTGDEYAKVYKAEVLYEFYAYRAGERDPSGSAAASRNRPPTKKPKKKAAAGPLSMGNTYLVGDNGPELLHMGTNAALSGATAARAANGAAMTIINFPAPTGDRIVDDILRQFREGVQVEGGGSVAIYFGGIPA